MTSIPPTLGAVRLPSDSEIVTDADEEVFLIYSLLQSKRAPSAEFRGLGQVDSRKDVLEINLDIVLSPLQDSESRPNSKRAKASKRRTLVSERTIAITLAQDKTALRTRKGDTGSILWKASIDFAQLILQQIYSNTAKSIFDPEKLRQQHILELGSGTGLLSIVFASLVARFTATDIGDLIPLIRKNIGLNFSGWPNCPDEKGANVAAEELDWVVLSSASMAQRKRVFDFDPVDILLVIDCIYHPSLLPHLVETIDYLAIPDRTVVFILVELRAEDVIREFLALWLQRPNWQIWRIGGGTFSMPYVAWVGYKSSA